MIGVCLAPLGALVGHLVFTLMGLALSEARPMALGWLYSGWALGSAIAFGTLMALPVTVIVLPLVHSWGGSAASLVLAGVLSPLLLPVLAALLLPRETALFVLALMPPAIVAGAVCGWFLGALQSRLNRRRLETTECSST